VPPQLVLVGRHQHAIPAHERSGAAALGLY
jgi:hypothetical protein